MHCVTHSEAARLLAETPAQVRRHVHVGQLEAGAKIDGQESVTFRSVARLAATLMHPLPGAPVDLAPFVDVRERVTDFHVYGVQRASIVRQLEGDALEAEQRGDLGIAGVLWQLAAALPTSQYEWNIGRATWTVRIPGIVEAETLPDASPHAAEPLAPEVHG